MGRPFKIRFDNGNYARVASVKISEEALDVRALLRLPYMDYALSVHAGAASADEQLIADLKTVFPAQLAPLIAAHNVTVLDGGTQAGLVGIMGALRQQTNGTFPLVGVLPADGAELPGEVPTDTRYSLEPNHTHFALVQGGSWGVESDLLVNMGRVVARQPVALLINGGEIVRKEALMHARAGNPLLVLAGSGRVADEIVDALKRGTSNNILQETLSIGKIRVCTPETLVEQLTLLYGWDM